MTEFPVLNFQSFIHADGERLTMDSRRVAAVFGKRHDDVLRRIRLLVSESPADFAVRNFAEGFYTLPETGDQQHPYYFLTRDGFALLAMGFTGKKALAFKIAYIDAFNAMADYIKYQQSSLDYRHFELQLEHRSKKAKASLCGKGLAEWKGEKPVLESAMLAVEETMCPELPILH